MASSEWDLAALESELLAALKAGDQAEQIRLYRLAGEYRLAKAQVDEGCFLLTNAWVLALAAGDPAETELQALLVQYGRVPE